MKDAIAKTDAAWRDQDDSLRKAIQALRSDLDAAQSERDKIRSSSVARESDLQKVRFLLRPPRSSQCCLTLYMCLTLIRNLIQIETCGGDSSTTEGPHLKSRPPASGIQDQPGQTPLHPRPTGRVA